MKTGLIGIAMLLALPWTAAPAAQQSLDRMGEAIFIGQIYPSGNAYLKPFAAEARANTDNLPTELSIVPLVGDRRLGSAPRQVRLSLSSLQSTYIPALEGMDEAREGCGPASANPRNTALEYLSEEFFEAMADHCDPNDNVAVYRGAASSYSYQVLGSTAEVRLSDVRYPTGLRPVPPSQQAELDRQKREADSNAAKLECTTVPVFADSAKIKLEARIRDGLSLRVSSYQTPGCAGHLGTIHILDVIQDGVVVRTFELIQSNGLL